MPDNQQLLENYLTQLNSALEKGDLETIEELLKQDVDLSIDLPLANSPDHPIITLLNSDKIVNKDDLLSKLVQKGATKITYQKSNILHHLIVEIELKGGQQHHKAVEMILNKDKSLLSGVDETGMNPISKAVELKNIEVCKILFKSGADPDSTLWKKKGHSLLYEAVMQDNEEMIDLILAQKPKIISVEIQAKELVVEKLLLKNKILNDEILKTCSSSLLETVISKHAKHSNLQSYKTMDNFVKKHKDSGAMLAYYLSSEILTEERIIALIKSPDSWVNVENQGSRALIYAVSNGYTEIVEALMAAGADVNIQNKYGKTALMFAAVNGYTEIAKVLMAAGADVNIQNKYGKTALMFAVDRKDIEILKDLIAANADVNARDQNGATALMKAVEKRDPEIVKVLMKANPEVNIQDKYGNTALLEAVKGGDIQVAKELIKAGAEVNIQDNYGNTALLEAVKGRDIQVAKELINAGAYNDLALIRASEQGYIEIVEKLIVAKHINLNAEDEYGNTALMCAAKEGRIDIAKDLIAAGANVDAKNKHEETALMYAAQNGYTRIAKDLIAAGADVKCMNRFGDTALTFAVGKEYVEIVKMIVANVDLKAKNEALVATTNVEIVKVLIAEGVDLETKDVNEYDNTALEKAVEYEHGEIVKVLITEGAKVTPNTFEKLNEDDKKLVKNRSKIDKKLDKKADEKLSKAFKEFKETGNFEQAFIDNKLYKHMSMDEKHLKSFEEKDKYVNDKKASLSVSDKIKSVFKGKETVKLEKVIKDLKKEVKKSDDYGILHKAKVAQKLNAPKENKIKSRD